MTASGTWVLREEVGHARDLHALTPDVPAGRELWHLRVTEPVLVLGSAQADTVHHDAAEREGIAVERRRSGGGAVLLIPGESTWIDVVLPRHDVLWDDDVTRSFGWLGSAWIETLRRVGIGDGDLAAHVGGLVRGEFGAAVCFAGMGPGEVASAGAKLVGLSQRRTREFARFQCTVHHRWRPDLYRRLLPADIAADVGLPPVATIDTDAATLVATLGEVLTTI